MANPEYADILSQSKAIHKYLIFSLVFWFNRVNALVFDFYINIPLNGRTF
jgi:hypothetical protein